jgi:hypothetical protein
MKAAGRGDRSTFEIELDPLRRAIASSQELVGNEDVEGLEDSGRKSGSSLSLTVVEAAAPHGHCLSGSYAVVQIHSRLAPDLCKGEIYK